MKFWIQPLLVSALLLGPASAAQAQFDFSVLPDRGGRDVRFTPAKPGQQARNEEVSVVIANDEGRRYRIIQQQMSPFMNERGQTLAPGAVKVFSSSSVGGRLGVVFPTPLMPGHTVIYDSDNTGTAEEFNLVFAFEPGPADAAGSYRSELVYQLESVEGGTAPVTVVLQVLAEVRPDFFLDVKNVTGGSTLDLGRITRQRLSGSAALQVQVGAGLGGRYRIYQRLADRISNVYGQSMDENKIVAVAGRADRGQTVAQEQPLSTSRTLIFESDDAGSAAQFTVEYRTVDLGSEIAGQYRSTVEFFVESDSSADFAAPVTVPLELEVETLFFLEVEHESAGGLNFGKFKNEGDMQTRRVRIQAHNNTGQRYQVIQRVSRLFTNEAGKSLPTDNFTAVMTGAQTGEMALMSVKPVPAGDTAVYTSDPDGSSDEFFIDYTLTLPKDSSGGEYTSETTYSLASVS